MASLRYSSWACVRWCRAAVLPRRPGCRRQKVAGEENQLVRRHGGTDDEAAASESPDKSSPDDEAVGATLPDAAVANQELKTRDQSLQMHRPAAKSPTVRRLLLLAGDGPVLIELHLSAAERPLAESWSQAFGDLVAALDEDLDGTTTWEELMDQPALYQLHAGEQLFDRPAQRQVLVESYDLNGDEVLQAEELQRLLGRQSAYVRSVRRASRQHT